MELFFLTAVDLGNLGMVGAAVVTAFLPAAFAAPLLYATIHKAKQKGFSKRAVQSTAVLLTSVAAALGAVVLALFGMYASDDVWTYRGIGAAFAAAAWSAAVVAIMYSIRGLSETDPKRKRRRMRGHSFALSGFSGGVFVMLGLFGGGAYYVWNARSEGAAPVSGPSLEAAAIFADTARVAVAALKDVAAVTPVAGPRGTEPAAPARPDAPPPTIAGNLPSASGDDTWFGRLAATGANTAASSVEPLDFAAFNFRLSSPGEGWIRIDAARAGQNAVVAFDRPANRLRFLILADRPGVEFGATANALMTAAQAKLRDRVPTMVFSPAEPRNLGGIAGLWTVGTGNRGDESCLTQLWVAEHNGYAYQLIVAASGAAASEVQESALSVFEKFSPLDAARVAHAAELAVAAKDETLQSLGCRVSLARTVWSVWPDYVAEFPDADYGARFDSQTGFVLRGVRLDSAPVEVPAATYVLFSQLGQPPERAAAKPVRKQTKEGQAYDEYVWGGEGPADKVRIARVIVTRDVAYLLLGWCDAEGSPRAEAVRAALDAVKFAAPEGGVEQLSAGLRARSARFYDDLGRYYTRQGSAAAAEQHLRAALKFAPDSAPILEHLVDAAFARRRFAEALKSIEAAPDRVQKSASIRVRRAAALAENGRRDDALKEYAAVFQTGYLDDEAFRRYMQVLEVAGKLDDALTAVTAYRNARNTPAMLALNARLLAARGESPAAINLLERQLTASPGDVDSALALAEMYRRAQRPLEALQAIEKLLAAGNDSALAHYWKGLTEYDLRRTRAAKDSFARAHQLDPADLAAKQMLDHVSGLLGEVENLRVRSPIDPVSLPKAVVDALPTLPMPDEFSRAPAYYLDRVTAYSFKPGTDSRRTEYHTIRVLNTQGVDELNTLSVRFDPLSEEVFVNRLDVYDDAGRPAAVGDPATYYLVDEEGVGATTRDRILQLPVPGLRPGYRVELIATVRSFVARPRFPYLHQTFGLRYPVRRQAVSISTDASRLDWSGSLADGVRRDAEGVWWQATDLRPLAREPFSPELAESEPTLYVAEKKSTWQDETKRYLEEISEQRNVPPNVMRAAQEMTAGLESPEAKLLAIAAFVQREIAFQPIPFGTRSRVPQSPEKTLNNRFGDSKDIAFLLAQMLATVEINTRIALVNTTEPVQTKLTTLDQFDHMVVIIPQGEGGRVIDATDKEADARLPVPLRLAGRDAFVLDDQRPRLVRLNRPALDAYRATVDRKVRFDESGTAFISEKVTFHDYYAAAMRGRMRSVPTAQRMAHWQTMLRNGGTPAVLRKWTVDRLDDLTQPLVVTAEYEVERTLTTVDAASAKSWVGSLPSAFESTLLTADAVEERRQPIDFPIGLRVQSQIEIEPPAGLPPPESSQFSATDEGDLLTTRRTARVDQGVLKVTLDLTRPSGRYAPSRYEDYRRALRTARDISSPKLNFTAPNK